MSDTDTDTTATDDHGAPRSTLELVRDRTLGTYLLGNFTSNTGNWFQNVAASIVVFRLTGSSTLVGVVAALQFGASLVLSPYAGSLADRFDRRRLLLGAQLLGATAAGALAVAVGVLGVEGLPGLWPILVATAVIGVAYAVSVPTLLSYVPALVPPRDLDTAIALNSVSFTVARAIGPAAAGIVVAAVGAAWAFGGNAVSFLGLVAALLLIGHRPTEGLAGADEDRSVREGIRRARASRPVLVTLLCTLIAGIAADPVNTLSPAVADRLGAGDAFVGFQVGAMGAGAACGTVLVGRLRVTVGRWRTVIIGMSVLGASLLGYAVAPSTWLVLLFLFVGGNGYLLTVTSLNADLQTRVDEALRGRMMALWSTAFLGSRPVAALLAGAAADLAGTGWAIAGMALLPLATAGWLVRNRPVDAPTAT